MGTKAVDLCFGLREVLIYMLRLKNCAIVHVSLSDSRSASGSWLGHDEAFGKGWVYNLNCVERLIVVSLNLTFGNKFFLF